MRDVADIDQDLAVIIDLWFADRDWPAVLRGQRAQRLQTRATGRHTPQRRNIDTTIQNPPLQIRRRSIRRPRQQQPSDPSYVRGGKGCTVGSGISAWNFPITVAR